MQVENTPYLSLSEVLDKYSIKGSTFSFVSPSEADNRILLDKVVAYYTRLGMSTETVQEEMFTNMTVAENLFLETLSARGAEKKRQISSCMDLISKYDLDFQPSSYLKDLTSEEKGIVSILRVLIHKPQVVVLENTASTFGSMQYDKFSRIVGDMVTDGMIVLLLTTKWEDTLKFSSDTAVRVEEGYYSVFSIREIEQNPSKVLYTLAGGSHNDGNLQLSKNSASYFALFKGSDLYVQNRQLDETIKYISDLVMRTFNAESCDVYFEGDDDHIFSYHADPGKKEYLLRESVVKNFLHDKEELLFLSKRVDDLNAVYVSTPTDCRILMGLPIVAVPKRVGMMAISFSYYFAYDSEQLLFLKTCCHQIAQIIQTSKLVNHSILLQESYHRIKNNLQMVVSLLYLTKLRLFPAEDKNDELEAVLDNVIKQIKSIAYVHEMMSVDTGGEVTNLNYIVDRIIGLYANENISIEKDVRNIRMTSKMATSVSMLINELLCNSCRHAFEQNRDNGAKVWVTLDVDEDRTVTLMVRDNGMGIQDPDSFFDSHSTGATIIRSLVKELRADFRITADHGTIVTISFPLG